MSGRLKVALRRVPATKPSWTAIATQLICDGESCHSRESAGTTAEPLNQSAIPNNSAVESSANARHRRGSGESINSSFVLYVPFVAYKPSPSSWATNTVASSFNPSAS